MKAGKNIPVTLAPLLSTVNTLPCSTTECERGFSVMNIIITKLKTKLLVSNVSAATFIKLNAPPLSIWNATPYIKSWIVHHRSAEDPQSRHVAEDKREEKREIWELFWKGKSLYIQWRLLYACNAWLHKFIQISQANRVEHANKYSL
jgi:hypothetical protein